MVRAPLNQLACLSFSTPSYTLRDFVQPHRPSVPVADDQRSERRGVRQLAVGLHGKRAVRAVERAGRPVDAVSADGGGESVHVEVARGQLPRIDVDLDGELLRARRCCTCATPFSVDMRWRDVDFGVLVDLRERQRRRAEREEDDREVRRVHLLERRRRAACPGGRLRVREMATCTSCAAASMSRSRSNCSVMDVLPVLFVELIDETPAMAENCFSSGVAMADAIVSGLAPGRLALTWNGREVDRRQIADRQRPVADDTEDDDRQLEQRRRDRPLDEQLGEVHDVVLGCRLGGFDGDPGTRRQPQLAIGHDGLSGLQATLDDDVVAVDPGDLDRPGLDGRVRLDDVHELALLAGLHRRVRHDDRVRIRRTAAA